MFLDLHRRDRLRGGPHNMGARGERVTARERQRIRVSVESPCRAYSLAQRAIHLIRQSCPYTAPLATAIRIWNRLASRWPSST